MKLTCKHLKKIVGKAGLFVYKGHNSFSGKPETRIDMSMINKETRVEIKRKLWAIGISIYQDDPLHNPLDYVVTY